MLPPAVIDLLSTETQAAAEDLLEDDEHVFLVDWREEDDQIIALAEDVLHTGDLSAEVVNIDADPGFEIYLSHRGQRVKVPLVVGLEDRHITLHTLNGLLAPAFEIRVCIASRGSDTLAFLALPAADWSTLEDRFGATVATHFRRIEARPNLFTESW